MPCIRELTSTRIDATVNESGTPASWALHEDRADTADGVVAGGKTRLGAYGEANAHQDQAVNGTNCMILSFFHVEVV